MVKMIDFRYLLESLKHFSENRENIIERIDKLVEQWKKEDEEITTSENMKGIN